MYLWEFSARTEGLDLERKRAPQHLLYSGLDKPFAVDKWRRQAASLQCWGFPGNGAQQEFARASTEDEVF